MYFYTGGRMKRPFDFLIALIILISFAPIILLLILLVRKKIGTPVFFSQVRPGLNAKPFKMFKFRTMTDAHDANGDLLPDSERLSRFGIFLRSSSLDELPGLWNVLKGDMSLVGPRPLLIQYLDRYTLEQSRRHELRPGITGWAQVNGRNAISWEDKFLLDVWYVDHQSMWLDIKILCLTVYKVILRSDISATGNVTMSEFMGSATTTGRCNGE